MTDKNLKIVNKTILMFLSINFITRGILKSYVCVKN